MLLFTEKHRDLQMSIFPKRVNFFILRRDLF